MENVQTKEEFFAGHDVKMEDVVQMSVPVGCDCMYSIFDLCTNSYDAPFLSINDASAIRLVKDVIVARDNTIQRHPEDFILYKIGSLDKNSGVLYPEKQPIRVITLKELAPQG